MSALFAFFASHRAELMVRLGEHILLVAVSTLIAAAIGIPLGIFAARRPRLAGPLVGLANLAQTIPSLALFGFLIPLPLIGGIGTRTALVALTLYGVLPIVRTTVAGLRGVDRAVLECAAAMGMTRGAGAAAGRAAAGRAGDPGRRARRDGGRCGHGDDCVGRSAPAGWATTSSAVWRWSIRTVILAGALPAALLALTADGLLALAARAADPSAARRRVSESSWRRPSCALACWVCAMFWWPPAAAVVVGSKNFTEQIMLGEILAQTIERTGLTRRAPAESRRHARLRRGAARRRHRRVCRNTPARR